MHLCQDHNIEIPFQKTRRKHYLNRQYHLPFLWLVNLSIIVSFWNKGNIGETDGCFKMQKVDTNDEPNKLVLCIFVGAVMSGILQKPTLA